MKKYWHIWVGTGMILLSVLIVLGVIFLPRMAAKSDVKDLLEMAAAPDAPYMVLVDPAYEHEGILAGEGREVRLDGALAESTRTALGAIAEGFSYEKKGSAFAGAVQPHLLVKTAEGTIVRIYLAPNEFWTELKGSAYYFTADDVQAYASFYNALMAAFS